jgi:hypothetical protein
MSYYGIHHWNAKGWSRGHKTVAVATPRKSVHFVLSDAATLLLAGLLFLGGVGLASLVKGLL